MEPISEKIVDETWTEITSITPEAGYSESINVSKSQPEVLSYIIEMTEDLDQEVRELAIFMFFVIHRMFQKAYSRQIGIITSDEIIASYKENEQLLESLGGIHEKFFERIARVQMSEQPYVIRYVVESIFEAAQDENPILLTEEDMGYLFLMMKTVVDVLNSKTDV